MGRHRDPYVLTDEDNRRLNMRAGKLTTFFAWWFGGLLLLGMILAGALLAGLR